MINLWKKGESITAARLNETAKAFNSRERVRDMLRLGIGGKQTVTVVSVHDDYLTCRPLNAIDSSADLYVAKPWDLRLTTYTVAAFIRGEYDDETYTAAKVESYELTITKVSDSSTETWRVVPPYTPAKTVGSTTYVGERITIERMPVDARFEITDTTTNYTIELEWEDCNRAGRAWAKSA